MKPLLGSLLLAGVCWLGAALDLPTMANFQNQKIVGHWYPVANIFIEKQFPQQFPEYTLKASGNGGLLYSYKYLHDGQCKEKSFHVTDQGSPGKFKTNSGVTLQILDTDYTTYTITYVMGGTGSYLTLAAKEKPLTSDLETKFGTFAASVGVSGEIVPVDPLEEC